MKGREYMEKYIILYIVSGFIIILLFNNYIKKQILKYKKVKKNNKALNILDKYLMPLLLIVFFVCL